MPNTIEIQTNSADLAAEAKVNAYVNRPTGTGSPEQARAALVREAVAVGVEYLRYGTEQTSFTGEHNDEAYGKALGLAEAAKIATGGHIDEEQIVSAVQVAYTDSLG